MFKFVQGRWCAIKGTLDSPRPQYFGSPWKSTDEESGMSYGLLRIFKTVGWVVTLGVSMSADAGLFGFSDTSWKEEVLLHDGGKIIVKRSQNYGGRHEIGQPLPIKEHTITFSLPGSSKTIKWVSEYGEDIGRTNFNLLAVHVLNDTPYIVASPNL